MRVIHRYIGFAIAATVANIGAQDIMIRLYGGTYGIFVAIAVGTVVGLGLKYALDKRYIFCFYAKGIAKNIHVFVLYVFMSVITTMIFWGVEFGFHYLFASKEMRYLGGIIGLSIGYTVKYFLDKRYVFRQENI